MQVTALWALALNCAEASLQEELWLRVGDDFWQAVGDHQDAKKDIMAIMAADMEVTAIREAAELPCGTAWADRLEAFDRVWREDMLVELHDEAGVTGRRLAIAAAALSNTKLSVVKRGLRSRVVQPTSGLVEGRRHSPLQFCISANPIQRAFERGYIGIGLNPPAEAVAEFLRAQDGTADARYDLTTATKLLQLQRTGQATWEEVMARAHNDTTRLVILDLASSLRAGQRMFVDDVRCRIAGHGHATHVMGIMDAVSRDLRFRYRTGCGKTEITAAGFDSASPIAIRDGLVEYVDRHTGLGIADTDRPLGAGHLGKIMRLSQSCFIDDGNHRH